MKKKELEQTLKSLGWYFMCHGGRHDRWTNGKETEEIPRHREIAELLAKKIIKTAKRYPGQ